ncbi:Uncharacterized protein APZ42_013453 [Daphnia magna]|uniref:Uncharacterized protein n=1 Tax=Daphnia magna TaxID=35525 RepID=A0A162QV94_9CRUS|nr:Uncharacterized protein APZ42_013453 [Daphnia magna]
MQLRLQSIDRRKNIIDRVEIDHYDENWGVRPGCPIKTRPKFVVSIQAPILQMVSGQAGLP